MGPRDLAQPWQAAGPPQQPEGSRGPRAAAASSRRVTGASRGRGELAQGRGWPPSGSHEVARPRATSTEVEWPRAASSGVERPWAASVGLAQGCRGLGTIGLKF